MENRNARPSWGIDAMLIDEEMLYLDEAEADRVYQELKARSDRRRQMEQRQNRLSSQMSLDEETLKRMTSNNGSESVKNFSVKEDDFKKDTKKVPASNKKEKEAKKEAKKESKKAKESFNLRKDSRHELAEDRRKESQSCEKIRLFIKKSNEQERLEFT